MNFILSKELGDAVLAYLSSRPYAEVSGLIAELMKIEEAPKPCVCKDAKPAAKKPIIPANVEVLDEVPKS